MNMTIVLVSKRSVELALLLAAVCSLAILATAENNDQLAESIRAKLEANEEPDGELLGAITKAMGEDIERTMISEMEQLLSSEAAKGATSATASAAPVKRRQTSEDELERLRVFNKQASQDIRKRIELVGDQSGQLPQMNLGQAASSLVEAARDRMTSVGSFVGSKMRSLSSSVSEKIPAKLKRFFRWPSFLQFKIRFFKRYPNLRTDLYRQFVFIKNQILVAMSNLHFITRRHSYILGQTQYSDMTDTEYRQTVGNKDKDDPADLKRLPNQAEVLAKLRSLDAVGKSIHGDQPAAAIASAKQSLRKRKRRSTRSVDMMDYEDDELDQSEDEDDALNFIYGARHDPMEVDTRGGDEAAFGAGLEARDLEEEEELDYGLVDQYASGADLDAVDEVSMDVEHAQKPNSKFDPVDLRNTSCIGRPENQENCGNCYALVPTQVATYHNCMDLAEGRRKPFRLNAKFVSDCGRYFGPEDHPPYYLKGCEGGRLTMAFEFIREVGAPGFQDYNFAQASAGILRANRDDCAFPKPANIFDHSLWPIPLIKSSTLSKMRPTVIELEDVHLHLKTVGPVMINVALWKEFAQYVGGVWDTLGPKSDGRHSMLIVGHEFDQKGREIFILWDSHGTPWGEFGYLRITAEALDHYKILIFGTLPNTVDL